ncbi:MAG: NADH/ubiquinone/plastoquinone (complex i) [Myxococcales bacterium]|nr:MAG: NADH/ubiquinone/plastoquinone (complex i) [Myxococcales bacterium]
MPSIPIFILLILCPITLLTVGYLCARNPDHRSRIVARALAFATAFSVAAALCVGLVRLLGAPSTSPLLGVGGLGLSLRVDALSVTIFTMVSVLAFVIGRFSQTYLDGDARHGVFMGWFAATVAAVQVLVLANNLLILYVGWVATSLCLQRLLVFYAQRPRARHAARKKFIVARLGDAMLAVAFVLLYLAYGTGDLESILVAHPQNQSSLVAIATVFIALTALLKSAQFPTHGWLVEMMETPTPVSALLHAGVLNAGPYLVLRFSPIMVNGQVASWLLIVFGGFTALFASVVLRTQPSVKVALGYSSAAHMGFMLFVCGLHVYPAVALHLVAHSFYKAHAFLSAGSAVDSFQSRTIAISPRLYKPFTIAASFVLALGAYLTVAWILGFTPWEEPSLVLIGAIVVLGLSQLLGASFDRPAKVLVYLKTTGLATLVTVSFFLLEQGAQLMLLDSFPEIRAPNPVTLVLGGVVVLSFFIAIWLQLSGWSRQSRFAQSLRVHVRHGLYANTLFDRWLGALSRSSNMV